MTALEEALMWHRHFKEMHTVLGGPDDEDVGEVEWIKDWRERFKPALSKPSNQK